MHLSRNEANAITYMKIFYLINKTIFSLCYCVYMAELHNPVSIKHILNTLRKIYPGANNKEMLCKVDGNQWCQSVNVKV